MKKSDVEVGMRVLIPVTTYREAVIESIEGPRRVWIRDEKGSRFFASITSLIPVAKEGA